MFYYVRAGTCAANSTDSHVQARTAPQTAGRSASATGLTGTGNDDAKKTQPDPSRALWVLERTTGIPHPIHPLPAP